MRVDPRSQQAAPHPRESCRWRHRARPPPPTRQLRVSLSDADDDGVTDALLPAQPGIRTLTAPCSRYTYAPQVLHVFGNSVWPTDPVGLSTVAASSCVVRGRASELCGLGSGGPMTVPIQPIVGIRAPRSLIRREGIAAEPPTGLPPHWFTSEHESLVRGHVYSLRQTADRNWFALWRTTLRSEAWRWSGS